jgi:predicted nicotinamide N-methyase
MVLFRSLLLTVVVENRAFAFSSFIVRSPSKLITTLNRNQLLHSDRFIKNYDAPIRSLSLKADGSDDKEILHDVHGIICREVKIDIDFVGQVSILEATADSQNELVDMALATEEEIASQSEGTDNLQLRAGDPYGAVLWPAASAVANHLLNDISDELAIGGKSLKEIKLLELGTGTGLVSLAAAIGGVSNIMATDYEDVPLKLLDFAAKNINGKGDGDSDGGSIAVEERQENLSNIKTFLFDICDHDTPLPSADIVVAADIMYEPKTGIAMAHRVVEALKYGSRVIVGCSPGRYVYDRWIKEDIILIFFCSLSICSMLIVFCFFFLS